MHLTVFVCTPVFWHLNNFLWFSDLFNKLSSRVLAYKLSIISVYNLTKCNIPFKNILGRHRITILYVKNKKNFITSSFSTDYASNTFDHLTSVIFSFSEFFRINLTDRPSTSIFLYFLESYLHKCLLIYASNYKRC